MHEVPSSLDAGPDLEGQILHISPSDTFRTIHTATSVVGMVALLVTVGALALLTVFLTSTVVLIAGSNWPILPAALVMLVLLLPVIGGFAVLVRGMRQTFVVSTRGIRSADWRASHTLRWAEIREVSAGPKNALGAMPMIITTTDGRRLRASMPAFISMGSRQFTFGDSGSAGTDPSGFTPPMLAAQEGLARYRRGEFGR